MKAGFSSRALLNNGRVSLIGGVLLLCAAGVAAQEHRAPGGPELPSSAEEWINSVPLTYDNLQGKGVVFWYFEEECPSCAAKWPSFKELAAQHAADPVLFVAVNSGNSPEAVKKYARQHSVNWPIIVDTARKFEAASDVGTISLENISQVCILTADGRFRRGRWDDLAGSVQTALTGAEWSLDPQQFAPAAREAVRCVEFGAYAAAVQKIRAGYKDASQDARQSFKQLAEIVNNRFAAAWREAEESVDPAQKWQAYQVYERVVQRFEGLPLPPESDAVWNALSNDPEIKQEVAAMKLVQAAERQLQSPREDQRRRAVNRLRSAMERYPQTEAATRARQLVEGR